jgi:hypothetical protein
MAIEHYRNFSYKGSRTGVSGKIIEIELLTWSERSKDRRLWQRLHFSRRSSARAGAAKGCDLLIFKRSKKDVWW